MYVYIYIYIHVYIYIRMYTDIYDIYIYTYICRRQGVEILQQHLATTTQQPVSTATIFWKCDALQPRARVLG